MPEAWNRLGKQEGFKYHGDLRPDNILVASDNSIMLIDPGHFDFLRSVHDNTAPMVVTTPAYYPDLLPPSMVNPAITPSLEAIILKGLGVKFLPDGTLDCQNGYANFLAFAVALMNNIEGL